ncbi:MAG: hypothetical protein IKP50_00365 [Bacilli bacterium]|nr:hypothetical protein [Bacilli bacterium]
MRVFVYSKKTSKTVAQINHVESVSEPEGGSLITFTTESGEHFSFNKKEVKTTTYQN